MPGCFFCFDGLDGSGKSTQMELFGQWLGESGVEFITCRDPGATPLGEKLRDLLLNHHELPISMISEMLLYQAARAQLVESVIRPALVGGTTVVSDRFLLANVVYQGHAGGLSVADIWHVGQLATGGLMPHLTFLFDLDAATARSRLAGPADRLESRDLDYWQRVREGYLAESQGRNDVIVVDAQQDVEAIQTELRRLAAPRLGL